MLNICRWTDLSKAEQERARPEFIDIFFESSSRKEFANQAEKDQFLQKWTDVYFERYSDWIYFAFKDSSLVGYLTGCPNSEELLAVMSGKLRAYSLFADLFVDFPAHLHINLSAGARGHGIGTLLIEEYCRSLSEKSIKGVHLVTSPDARNRSFYLKNEFKYEVQREHAGHQFLFMGRTL